jgi:hypothetical protein
VRDFAIAHAGPIDLQQLAQLWAFLVDLFRFTVWLLHWLAGAG